MNVPKRILLYLALLLGSVVMLFPFYLMVITSLSSLNEVFCWPPVFWPKQPQFENYLIVLRDYQFGKYFLNSFIAAGGSTIGVLLFDTMAGYAFSRLQFRGKKGLFLTSVITNMIPWQVVVIPLFIMFKKMPLMGGNNLFGEGGHGMLNTYAVLIIPFVSTTFGTYLMREFFRMLPPALLDAGRVDGCSEFKIFRRIYLPLAKPALSTLGILWFTESWNAYLWPLIVLTTKQMHTVQLGMSVFAGQYTVNWHLMMAAVVISCLPVLLIFIIGQKQFIKGVAFAGVKG